MAFLPSFDNRLVARVRKYISEHQRVTSDQMAEDLQQIYSNDYGRRKRNSFRKLVRQVHQAIIMDRRRIMDEEGRDQSLYKRRRPVDGRSRHSSSDSGNEEMLMEYSNGNALNSSMASMYKKKQRKSFSAPASPFSYVDCPSEPGGSIMGFQGEEKDAFNGAQDTAVDNMEMTNINFNNQLSSHKMAVSPNKLIPLNLISKDQFLKENSTPAPEVRVSQNKRTKQRKQVVKSGEHDHEVTGEKAKPKFEIKKSDVKFADIGGNEKALREIGELVFHVKYPTAFKSLGMVPPYGILLHGPPGCGKTLLANAIAGESDLPFMEVAATEMVSGISGESEQKLRDLFEVATASAPCVIFIDEIDAITPKRELASKDMERRIVTQLLSCLDDLRKTASQILVIGATNRPDSIDPALRRAGRFDREISMGIPDEKARHDILRVLCKNLKLEDSFNFSMLARLTPGYVGADLMSLCCEATKLAARKVLLLMKQEIIANDSSKLPSDENHVTLPSDKQSELSSSDISQLLRRNCPPSEAQLQSLFISFVDFKKSLLIVQPSAKREGFATVPDVTWDDIGALENIRDKLTVDILGPVRNPDVFSAAGLTKPPGILLAGPPGCGKTLLAKAIANESGINFISVKGPELLNMYVGESERAVRQCFERARNSSPCVIFFDEIDALCRRRSGSESESTSRVVNQMLTEMDGLEARGQVFVMAATNRPERIDPAVLRPGRLGKTLYVGLPNTADRIKILQTLTHNGTKPTISNSVSLEAIAKDDRCKRFTGADLSSLVREATVNAIRKHISSNHMLRKDSGLKNFDVKVTPEHLEKAFREVKPSISARDEKRYKKLRINLENR